MNKYLYYPGCSMESSARAYAESLSAIVDEMNLKLNEIHDWNCCGATEYISLNKTPSMSINEIMACECTFSFLAEPVRY